jgi:hypothetical protein
MKKLLLAFVIMLCSITTFSQSPSFEKVVQINKLEFVDGKFETVETIRPTDFYIKIDARIVFVNGKKFITHGNYEMDYHEGFVSYTWKCVDEDGQEGYFIMKKFTKYEGMIMMLGFGNKCLEFVTK